MTAFKPAMLVHARSPIQPVIVKHCEGWTKRTQEQMKLIPNALYTEVFQYTSCEYSTV